MFRSFLLLTALMFAPFGKTAPTQPLRPADGFHQIRLNGHTFTLPAGFTIELAAVPPLCQRPVVAAFDEKGGLYVCDSSGSNEKVEEQLRKKPHRILRLEDTDGDGKFDKSTVFVSNVMLPEGAMWLDGSLYVAAPPCILKFTDTDGDGKADKEEVWFDGKTLTGCANDLHGPYIGPDGWIYWCKGAFAKQEYTLPNGTKFSTRAAHVFRARPDGSRIEPVMAGGMDNPVDLVFTPSGERIFSTTFFQHPANGKRDGLVHAVYGGVYGKDHDPIHEHPWTSPQLMPLLTHLGPAAPCGLHRYESDQFGKEFESNLFCCQFNLRKVSRHILVPAGSTFTTKDSDFLVSDNLDFHPTDVLEDADGSLLVIDTGGWYKLCCPTSQLVKPDVTGAIYRVKKIGAHKIEDPRGLKIDWAKVSSAELTGSLDDSRPVVYRRAIGILAVRREVELLATFADERKFTVRQRLGAVWALARIAGPEAREGVRKFLGDADESIRNAALHVVALGRDREALAKVMKLAAHASPQTGRVAAEALGRIGDPKAILAIFDALANEKNDRVLDHSLTYALIEIGVVRETAEGLKHPSPRVRRAVLSALENIPASHLDSSAVVAELNAKDSALRETAWWVAGRHPQWGDRLAGYFTDRLKIIEGMTPPERDELAARLLPFLKSAPIRKAVGDALAGTTDTQAVRPILRALAKSGLKALPSEWTEGLLCVLYTRDDEAVRDAIAVLRAVPPTVQEAAEITAKVRAYRRRLAAPLPKDLEYALLAAAPPGTRQSVEIIDSAIADLHRDRASTLRAAAADLLTRAAVAPESLIALAQALKTANPVEVGKLLQAFATSQSETVGLPFVAALSDPALRSVIRIEMIKPILDKYSKPVRDEAEKLYALLQEARAGERQKLERLLKEMPAGDIRRGQIAFNGTKGVCATCHKIGYVGGTVGPDLTRIGGIRTERDLLEAIVFPSASFVRSYEPVKVTTLDGRSFNGILKKDAADEIIVVVAADKEERIARDNIEEIKPSSVSIMPAGFDQQLSPQEIADLIAFLKACR